jgi:hypothetical protein
MQIPGDPLEGREPGASVPTLVALGALLAGLVLAALVIAGCGGSEPAGPPDAEPPPPSTLIAFASSFDGFRQWTAFHDDGPPAGTVAVDALGPRTQYLNRIPDHGATSWPVGTIIVEQRESGQRPIFAGVKRGGGFNSGNPGAPGWEWFELSETPQGKVAITWRGLGPPDGSESYGGSDRCNLCHAVCAENDYICSPILQLSQF